MSTADLSPSFGIAAYRDLRATRRAHRIEEIDWLDALYKVYVSAVVGIVITLIISSWLGNEKLDAAGLSRFDDHAPAAIGVLAGLALAIGLRSGSRGGPVAVEAADVRHVLLAPVDRGVVLRTAALRQLRTALFTATVVGAIAGQLAVRRLGGNAFAWIGAGAAGAVVVTLLSLGTAMCLSGRRAPRWIGTVGAIVVLTWSLLDLFDVVWSPMRVLAGITLWPRRVEPVELVGVALAAALIGLGLRGLGGVSLEQAENRSRLVGQLRFAVTVQDLRTAMVLRRQLAQDTPRARPWLPVPGHRLVVVRRGLRGVLRFPAARVARVLVLGGLAGLALAGVWRGTYALVVLAGALGYVAALDVVEPLAQEVDQHDRSEAVPVDRGELLSRHLIVPALLMVLVGAVGVAVAVAVVGIDGSSIGLAAVLALPAAGGALSGAVVSVVQSPPEPFKDGQLLPPEVAGMKVALRAALPLVLAVVGCLPTLFAARSLASDIDPWRTGPSTAMFVLFVPAITAAWVRYQVQAKAWWRELLAEGQTANRDRLSGRGAR